MGPLSSTTSSRIFRTVAWLLLLAALVFAFDIIIFRSAFAQYDKLNHLNDIKKPFRVVVIGSSNILWALDPVAIESKTGMKTAMFAIAGGNIEFRYHTLKEYIDRHREEKPDLILFHADRYVFSKKRYGTEAYLSLQGYYHAGLYRDFLDHHWNGSMDSRFKKIFKVYSLNSEAYFILSKYMDRIPVNLPLTLLTGPLMAEPMPLERSPVSPVSRIEQWKKNYEHLTASELIDSEFKGYYNLSTDLLKKYGVRSYLLETPMADGIVNEADFETVRSLLRHGESNRVRYLRITGERIESDTSLYFDASHLNLEGRQKYTRLLLEHLRVD